MEYFRLQLLRADFLKSVEEFMTVFPQRQFFFIKHHCGLFVMLGHRAPNKLLKCFFLTRLRTVFIPILKISIVREYLLRNISATLLVLGLTGRVRKKIRRLPARRGGLGSRPFFIIVNDTFCVLCNNLSEFLLQTNGVQGTSPATWFG